MHHTPLVIIARSHVNFKDYCRQRGMNPKGGKEAVYVSSRDDDSYLRVCGMLLKKEQVIVLDKPQGRLFDMLVIRILRGEGEMEMDTFDDQFKAITKHLETEVSW